MNTCIWYSLYMENTDMAKTATVELVKQFASNRYARMATKVTLENGRVVMFTERLPKKLAFAAARATK